MYHHVVAPVVDPVIGAGVEILKTAVKGAELRDAVMASGGSGSTETPKQIMERVDGAFKATGEAVQTVMKPVVSAVQSSIELATGSKRAGEVLAEPVLMALTEGIVAGVKPALTVAKTGLKTAVNTVRQLEVTIDSAALMRQHHTGLSLDAFKIGTKPSAPAATSLEIATGDAAVPVVESGVSSRPLSLPYVESGRNLPGKAMMSFELTNPEVLMRGTHNSAGKVLLEVAQKLEGRSFKDFDTFREAFWIEMSKSRYAKDFGEINYRRMLEGNAPIALESQQLGGRQSYEIHHMTPIHDGGPVYDMSNLLISTPKYHKEVLEPGYHYKRTKR